MNPLRSMPRVAHAFVALAGLVAGLALAAPAQAAPFQFPISFTIGSGLSLQCETITVAENTQLTITFASVATEASTTGQEVTGVFVFTKLTGQSTDSYNVVPMKAVTSTAYQGAQVMTAYADAGITNNPRLCVLRSTTAGTMSVYGTVNGFTTVP